ncbi:MAG: hypothetical protein MZU91_00820 [Desulfosudis oleivorans]|nr:hypothetical protein [Desulfosudis oleivorans]
MLRDGRQRLMGQIVVGEAAVGDGEPPGFEVPDEGGVIEREDLLEDVGPGIGVEDDVIDVGARGGGAGDADVLAGPDPGAPDEASGRSTRR